MSFGETQIEFDDLNVGDCEIGAHHWLFELVASGRAIVEFDREADWWIASIEIAIMRPLPPIDGRRQYAADYADVSKHAPWLYDAMEKALREQWADKIQEQITEEFHGMGFVLKTDCDNGEKYFAKSKWRAA